MKSVPAALGEDTAVHTEVDGEEREEDDQEDRHYADHHDLHCCQKCSAMMTFQFG